MKVTGYGLKSMGESIDNIIVNLFISNQVASDVDFIGYAKAKK